MEDYTSIATSYYATVGGLSQVTMDLYNQLCRQPRVDSRELFRFVLTYLQDVVPQGIIIGQGHTIYDGANSAPYYEVDLLLSDTGRIFMSGLVSMDNDARHIERLGADEATQKEYNGLFVQDDGWLRYFTVTGQIYFYSVNGNRPWEFMGMCRLVEEAREVSEYLQAQYDSLVSH